MSKFEDMYNRNNKQEETRIYIPDDNQDHFIRAKAVALTRILVLLDGKQGKKLSTGFTAAQNKNRLEVRGPLVPYRTSSLRAKWPT